MLYPKRSKEKSPRAAITHPVAVNRTETVTWKVTMTKSQLLREFPTWWSFSAGMWHAIYYNKDDKCDHFKTRWLPIRSNLLNQIHCAGSRKGMQCSIFSFGIKQDVRKLSKRLENCWNWIFHPQGQIYTENIRQQTRKWILLEIQKIDGDNW